MMKYFTLIYLTNINKQIQIVYLFNIAMPSILIFLVYFLKPSLSKIFKNLDFKYKFQFQYRFSPYQHKNIGFINNLKQFLYLINEYQQQNHGKQFVSALGGQVKYSIIIYSMIYFSNNTYFGVNIQNAYAQLSALYSQLSSDYEKSILSSQKLQIKIENLTKQIQQLRSKNITKSFQRDPEQPKSSEYISHFIHQQKTLKTLPKHPQRIKRQNSIQTSESNIYQCTYKNCSRIYKSSVSMNLHIKIKHNGGTKKQREEYAKAIIDAEQRGQEPPRTPISFPPNFLQEFRTTYQYMKKYAM